MAIGSDCSSQQTHKQIKDHQIPGPRNKQLKNTRNHREWHFSPRKASWQRERTSVLSQFRAQNRTNILTKVSWEGYSFCIISCFSFHLCSYSLFPEMGDAVFALAWRAAGETMVLITRLQICSLVRAHPGINQWAHRSVEQKLVPLSSLSRKSIFKRCSFLLENIYFCKITWTGPIQWDPFRAGGLH